MGDLIHYNHITKLPEVNYILLDQLKHTHLQPLFVLFTYII